MQAYNPYLPSYEYVPDGEPRVFGDRLYIYGSHDKFNGKTYCENDYVCWSCDVNDRGNWKYEGVMYRKEQDPGFKGEMQLFAPDVVRGIDGRYYLYYVLNGLNAVSVAVAEKPNGPFTFYGYVKKQDGSLYGAKKGEKHLFDPAVLVDGDEVFLYLGFAPFTGSLLELFKKNDADIDGGYCVKLDGDMLTVISSPKLIVPCHALSKGTSFINHAFYEASSIRKYDDIYYFVYSSEQSHELCYATSNFPDRDFVYGGTVVSHADIGFNGNKIPMNYTGNNHGGIAKLPDGYYIFYHRQTNQSNCCRQGLAEKINLSGKKIEQAEMTSCGLNGKCLMPTGVYPSYIACRLYSANGTYCYEEKIDGRAHPYFTQTGKDRNDRPNQYIKNMQNGSTAVFKYFGFDGEKTKIIIRVKGTERCKIIVKTTKENSVLSEIEILPTKRRARFSSSAFSVDGVNGLSFTIVGNGICDFYDFELIKL